LSKGQWQAVGARSNVNAQCQQFFKANAAGAAERLREWKTIADLKRFILRFGGFHFSGPIVVEISDRQFSRMRGTDSPATAIGRGFPRAPECRKVVFVLRQN
jgi:hypothetical protein